MIDDQNIKAVANSKIIYIFKIVLKSCFTAGCLKVITKNEKIRKASLKPLKELCAEFCTACHSQLIQDAKGCLA